MEGINRWATIFSSLTRWATIFSRWATLFSSLTLGNNIGSRYIYIHFSTPSWPLPFRLTGISRKRRVFPTIFPGIGPSKNCFSKFLTRLLHRPGPLDMIVILGEMSRVGPDMIAKRLVTTSECIYRLILIAGLTNS